MCFSPQFKGHSLFTKPTGVRNPNFWAMQKATKIIRTFHITNGECWSNHGPCPDVLQKIWSRQQCLEANMGLLVLYIQKVDNTGFKCQRQESAAPLDGSCVFQLHSWSLGVPAPCQRTQLSYTRGTVTVERTRLILLVLLLPMWLCMAQCRSSDTLGSTDFF